MFHFSCRFAGKEVQMFIKLKSSWLIVSQILFIFKSYLMNVIRCGRKKRFLYDWCLEAVARPRQISRDWGQDWGRRARELRPRQEDSRPKVMQWKLCLEAPHHCQHHWTLSTYWLQHCTSQIIIIIIIIIIIFFFFIPLVVKIPRVKNKR